MDSTLRGVTDWEKVLENGRIELSRVLAVTGMRTGKELSLLEIGCGMGRITFALADRFGSVLGMDVSPSLLQRAERQNDRPNVKFALSGGQRLAPDEPRTWDVVFSLGVFYYLQPGTLCSYLDDAFALLQPGGQFVFDMNCTPIPLRTRLSFFARRVLHLCGVRDWHGWPTAPGFQRQSYSASFLRERLMRTGFGCVRVVDTNPADTWFVATRAG